MWHEEQHPAGQREGAWPWKVQGCGQSGRGMTPAGQNWESSWLLIINGIQAAWEGISKGNAGRQFLVSHTILSYST